MQDLRNYKLRNYKSLRPLLPFDAPAFRRALLSWYGRNRRPLPWRETHDPYRIWVSEIMLQQTRVAAVIPYYERFLARFPDVVSLAKAREPAVLAAWSGLGYYRRARHLHAAAREVVKQGRFPATSDEIRQLPGIGRYTASAIASIAFGEPCAVVDGNVERVLARITARELTGESAWGAAEFLLARRRPGDFNQAMMELGATICTPKTPQCAACPVRRFCATRGEHPAAKQTRRVRRRISRLLAVHLDRVLLVRRSNHESLMPGMWELPRAISSETTAAEAMFRLRHSILNTDFEVIVRAPRQNRVLGLRELIPGGKWVRIARLPEIPLTGLSRKVLRQAGIIRPV